MLPSFIQRGGAQVRPTWHFRRFKRRTVLVHGITPLHYTKRTVERFNPGDPAWVSFDGRRAWPVIILAGAPGGPPGYAVRFERPSRSLGLDTLSVHGFRLDELRSTPELACLNRITG